jgi:intracellular septation protein A
MEQIAQNPPSRRGQAVNLLAEICVNFVLPYIIYVQTQANIGQLDALLASSLPPILWSIIEFIRKRRVDAVSLLVVAGIVLSLLAFFGGGSARFLQLRENLVTGVIGLVFLGSAIIGKPLIYQLARASMARKSAATVNEFQQLRGVEYFEATMMIMTVVWGVGLLAETAIACVLVYSIPISTYLIVSPFLGYGFMGALGLWTFLYARRRTRIGKEMRARAEV